MISIQGSWLHVILRFTVYGAEFSGIPMFYDIHFLDHGMQVHGSSPSMIEWLVPSSAQSGPTSSEPLAQLASSGGVGELKEMG